MALERVTSQYEFSTTRDREAAQDRKAYNVKGARRRREMYRRGCSSYQRLPIRLHRRMNRSYFSSFKGKQLRYKGANILFLNLQKKGPAVFFVAHPEDQNDDSYRDGCQGTQKNPG